MTRKRVVRVLVYEGSEDWINKTLARSFITSTPFVTGTNTIYELSSTTFQEPPQNGQPTDPNKPNADGFGSGSNEASSTGAGPVEPVVADGPAADFAAALSALTRS